MTHDELIAENAALPQAIITAQSLAEKHGIPWDSQNPWASVDTVLVWFKSAIFTRDLLRTEADAENARLREALEEIAFMSTSTPLEFSEAQRAREMEQRLNECIGIAARAALSPAPASPEPIERQIRQIIADAGPPTGNVDPNNIALERSLLIAKGLGAVVSEQQPEFAVGQVWRDEAGNRWRLDEKSSDGSDPGWWAFSRDSRQMDFFKESFMRNNWTPIPAPEGNDASL